MKGSGLGVGIGLVILWPLISGQGCASPTSAPHQECGKLGYSTDYIDMILDVVELDHRLGFSWEEELGTMLTDCRNLWASSQYPDCSSCAVAVMNTVYGDDEKANLARSKIYEAGDGQEDFAPANYLIPPAAVSIAAK